jgi:hypothetical protein
MYEENFGVFFMETFSSIALLIFSILNVVDCPAAASVQQILTLALSGILFLRSMFTGWPEGCVKGTKKYALSVALIGAVLIPSVVGIVLSVNYHCYVIECRSLVNSRTGSHSTITGKLFSIDINFVGPDYASNIWDKCDLVMEDLVPCISPGKYVDTSEVSPYAIDSPLPPDQNDICLTYKANWGEVEPFQQKTKWSETKSPFYVHECTPTDPYHNCFNGSDVIYAYYCDRTYECTAVPATSHSVQQFRKFREAT